MESLWIFLLQVCRIAAPYLLASMGATYSERSGVINLAVEGLMLVGAFGAVVGQVYTGSAAVGVLVAVGFGLILAAIHALMTVTFKANQIVSGIALNILAVGLTKFCLRAMFGSASNSARVEGFGDSTIMFNPIFLIALAIVPLSQLIFFQTAFGLRLRAIGENAEAAATLGIPVETMRYQAILISGTLAALAGAYLAFQQHSFTDGMIAGRGYISLATMIIGKWLPLGAAAASFSFAFIEAMQLNLQSDAIPTQLIQALPYLVTLLALVGFIGKSTPPREIGKPLLKRGN